MNSFDARLEKKDGQYTVSTGGVTVTWSKEKQKKLSTKNVQLQAITMGVRPGHITLGEGCNSLTATVDASKMMGSKVRLCANAQGLDAVIIVPTSDHGESFTSGSEIRFTFSGSVCHLFDSEGKIWRCNRNATL